MLTAIGLTPDGALDGVDAAWIETDGDRVRRRGSARTVFGDDDRATLIAAITAARDWNFEGPEPEVFAAAEAIIHAASLAATQELMAKIGKIDVIGLQGLTVLRRAPQTPNPQNLGPQLPGKIRQLANAGALAREVGVPVVSDFFAADIAAGGHGAPLTPIYHAALLRETGLERPLGVLNLGDVTNITWWNGDDDTSGGPSGGLRGFDTGPGYGLLDAWIERQTSLPFDDGGDIAAAGTVNTQALAQLLADPYFTTPPPKSLNRHVFDISAVDGLSVEDGAATLTAFVAEAVVKAIAVLPSAPQAVVVTGGGGRNPAMLAALRTSLPCGILLADALGWGLGVVEAELTAYLAVRSLHELPITFPGTTGAPQPLTGGVVVRPY